MVLQLELCASTAGGLGSGLKSCMLQGTAKKQQQHSFGIRPLAHQSSDLAESSPIISQVVGIYIFFNGEGEGNQISEARMHQRCQINIYQNNITSSTTFTKSGLQQTHTLKKITRNARVRNGKLESHSKKLTAWSREKTGRGKKIGRTWRDICGKFRGISSIF